MISSSVRKTLFISTTIILVLAVSAFAVRSYNMYRFHVEKQTRFMMDTFVNIVAVGPQPVASKAVKAAFERMQEVSDKFNPMNPDGPIYAFNTRGVPITDPEILHVAESALAISQMTDGAFDVTIEPLIELWGFYTGEPSLPDDSAIHTCLGHTGYRHLRIASGSLVKDNPSIRIDLGGIAKGYAISQARDTLKSMGIESAMIDAGGDIYAMGTRGRDLWRIGLRSPRGNDILGFMEVEDLAVMGSGDYERFFMKDGKRFHHIFDPKTGYPSRGLRGTTLVYADPMLADAWNTAIFVLGPEKGRALVEKTPGMEAVFVTETGNLLVTSGLTDALKINQKKT